MSVTTVLVPVLMPEAETLLAGEETPDLLPRAERLRRRVGRLDTIREDLHALLVPLWERELARAPRYRNTLLTRLLKRSEPPRIPSGYDPYVHLFGRSFPVAGESAKVVVQRVAELLKADDDVFASQMAQELGVLERRAPGLFADARAEPDGLARAIEEQRARIAAAMGSAPANLRAACNAVGTLSAWSWPVWRLDGIMLGDLLRLLGITQLPGSAAPLFEELAEARPEIAPQLGSLPKKLEDFAGVGALWTSTDVKLVAGSFRLYRAKLARNAVENAEDPAVALRHLRLLEEAVLFCEAEGLALAETAGLEWHERTRQTVGT